jgi:phosphoribosylglycinamide formyltransferase 2
MSETASASGARPQVLLLGSDDFGHELTIALHGLGAEVTQVDGHADELVAAIERLQPDFVVTLTDAVPAAAFEAIEAFLAKAEEDFTELVPSARSVRLTADREGLRKLAADELGLPTAPFWFAGSLDELKAIAAHGGLPLLVRPVTGAPSAAARRPKVVRGPEDVEPAWQHAVGSGAPNSRVMAETVVNVEFHITLLAARTDGPDGPAVEFCSPIGHRGAGADVLESWQPQNLSPAATDAAKSIAARIVKSLGGRGLFSVELMIDGDEVYFVDVSASPHASAWVTLRSQRLSAFELQARAILGVPVDTMMCSPGAARLVDADGPPAPDQLIAALRVPESDVRVLGRSGALALATAHDVAAARDAAREVAAALSGRRQP